MMSADGQLAGMPSMLFDAFAIIPSDEGAKALSLETAAMGFVRDAFGHLKAIAADEGTQTLLKVANIRSDTGVVGATDRAALIAARGTRQ